ncbi:DinB family protein [Streptomyces sp. AC536]|uniref:DinB family protein n=1 Tax=Streptomyces buecherae TaxID=2763006 RepID=UPI00164D0650|nr:DinB family protein [Streptomyces buecherae]MBC3982925.1 DinB family protein [Streptomyces buecherae]QNJ41560.1 DinB family protein [Streptomyces buecherae]
MPTFVDAEPRGDERTALLNYLAAQRGGIRRALLGLTDEQATQKPTVSELSLFGLLKHVAEVEQGWIMGTLAGRPEETVQRTYENWHESFDRVGEETVAGLLAYYEKVARQTEEYVNSLPDLDVVVTLPEAPWYPEDRDRSARWILLTMIQEVARHAGHADIIREAVDGKTAFVLVDEAGDGAV